MARQKKGRWGCLTLIIFMLVMGLCAMIGEAVRAEDAKKAQKYHDTMAVVENSTTAVTGEKMVSLVTSKRGSGSDPTYCKEYIPEGYETDVPQEVRYVLRCTKDADLVGTYSGGGGSGWTPWVEIEILDRKTGQVIGSQKFEGGYPPTTVRSGGAHYGSEPSMEKIHEWILSVIHSSATKAPVNTVSRDTITVYAQIPAGWSSPGCWVWSSETGEDAFEAWPGKSMIYDDGWYVISVPSWINYVIINANNGSAQTADLPVESGKDVWVVVTDSGGLAQVYYQEP